MPSELSATAEAGCGGMFSDAHGSFFGPYYLGENRNLKCVWTINSPEHYPMRLMLNYINLDCATEYIAVYNGEPDRSTLLKKICEGETTLYSYSGMMTLVVYRHSNTEGQGFIAFYDVGAAFTTPLPRVELTTHPEETSGLMETTFAPPTPAQPDIKTIRPKVTSAPPTPTQPGIKTTTTATTPEVVPVFELPRVTNVRLADMYIELNN
ncbi:putative DMBT1-like protein [Protobothrops mucrosquamatus]|uniref:putative DMBT1-like protein n=1 Tax=Protobothrops mucrosquamatus TaxID=103944 RepID=UPI0007757748|nr:putative DMBT1-like protein [Protobothrops mucrosquamatus]